MKEVRQDKASRQSEERVWECVKAKYNHNKVNKDSGVIKMKKSSF